MERNFNKQDNAKPEGGKSLYSGRFWVVASDRKYIVSSRGKSFIKSVQMPSDNIYGKVLVTYRTGIRQLYDNMIQSPPKEFIECSRSKSHKILEEITEINELVLEFHKRQIKSVK